MPANTTLPQLPCHAVIFISQRTPGDNGYGDAVARIGEIGARQPGFLGIASARAPDGAGITVVFYETAEAAKQWGRNPDHRAVIRTGIEQWYEKYAIYYAEVNAGHKWEKAAAD
jgi:heme-degrading monooxygenase HmoA